MITVRKNNVLRTVFNNIECIFRKNGIFRYLIFCESDKNKKILDDHIKVIDGIKEEVLSFVDEFEDEIFIMGKDFMRFRFKTNDKLLCNQKLNVPVCVVSMSSVVKKGDSYLRKKLNSLKREKLKIFKPLHQKRCTRKDT